MREGKRVLLTGGSGDLGHVLAPLLQTQGYRVLSLDPLPSPTPRVTSIQGSILNRDTLPSALSQVDIVIHIAAWHGFHAFTQSKSAEEFWDLNMTGTFNVLEACAKAQVKNFVFISSTSVDEWPEMYGVTKLLGEELCAAYAQRAGMRIISLRPRAFIPWWNRSVYRSKEEWASWFARGAVHINDVADAVVQSCSVLLNGDEPFHEVIELDGKHDFSEADRALWSSIGTKAFLSQRYPHYRGVIERASFLPEAPPSYKDTTKAEGLIGYQPRYGYGELLAELSTETS